MCACGHEFPPWRGAHLFGELCHSAHFQSATCSSTCSEDGFRTSHRVACERDGSPSGREAFLHCQYPKAWGNIYELRSLGAIVLHDFDATRLDSTVVSRWLINFDRVVIVWNFPHPGWGNKQPATRVQESDPIMIRRHRDLLSRFFHECFVPRFVN
jgi:hypothetical protein